MLNPGMFRPRNLVMVAIAAIAAVAAVGAYAGLAEAGSSGGGRHAPKVKVSCELNLIAVLPPRTLKAENYGTVACDKVAGDGVQHDSSTVTPTSRYTGHFTGPVKQFFDKGTVSGTFTINYVTDPTTLAVTYEGTIDITSGTGDYKRVRGHGTLTGFSPDAIRTKLQEELTLTRW